tara:strand:- start:4649 stop:4954 length:306 start_codon:yes stop_codon:yes gene_type:complete
MAFFIKTEIIKKEYLRDFDTKREVIQSHINWVIDLKSQGFNIKSGFLVDNLKRPGGGGFLILESNSYADAIKILKNDPMITHDLVNWEIHQWIDVIEKDNF